MKKLTYSILISLLLINSTLQGQNSRRWSFTDDKGITWHVTKGQSHTDHIEMSGLQASSIIKYGVDDNGELTLTKRLVLPMLRTIPNNTHASLRINFDNPNDLVLTANGVVVKEYPRSFTLNGTLIIQSSTNGQLEMKRTLFPSVDKPALIEKITLKNTSNFACNLEIKNNSKTVETDPAAGVYGKYIVRMEVKKEGKYILAPDDEFTFSVIYSGRKATDEIYSYSGEFELKKRIQMVTNVFDDLVLETPNDTINREFAFAKLRTTESIFDTKGGLMHSPGGDAYYAAIWANDQAEYANPFFPFLGNINGNESAINAYRLFASFMNPDFNPIPSSIIAEGVDFFSCAGDRGDMAMIAYGASRFALASGKIETAKELWPLITWCFEYLERKKTHEGVIASDSDELEGRFDPGKVNLSTNSLAYGGYLSAANLADDLGKKKMAETYRRNAATLRGAIEKYFGANVQGFNTYKYHKDNDKLRAWICIPLVMGITDRKEETIKALFSDYLWTSNGILTESGSTTFWDRSTLYAFRGLLANGATDHCMNYFSYYSTTRLLGEHVPYPVEAWPEGDQRQLAAESALYCRAVTEGLFGINPTGLNRFTLAPWLPDGWNYMKLLNIKSFDHEFDIEVARKGSGISVSIKKIGGTTITKQWGGKETMEILLE